MLFVKEADDVICLSDDENILVFPLRVEEIEMLIENQNYFENYINLSYQADSFENDFMKKQYEIFKASNSQLPWLSVWTIVSVRDKTIVGTIDIKKEPNENGEVEIGYGVAESFRRRGYATTAVKLFLNWLFENGVKIVYADVGKDNVASKRVLEKNEFSVEKDGQMILYKKENL